MLPNAHILSRVFIYVVLIGRWWRLPPGFFPSFFGGSMDDYLRDSVSYKKDVEGLSFTYRFNLYRNIRYMDNAPDQQRLKCLLPCTALSVVKILESIGAYDPA